MLVTQATQTDSFVSVANARYTQTTLNISANEGSDIHRNLGKIQFMGIPYAKMMYSASEIRLEADANQLLAYLTAVLATFSTNDSSSDLPRENDTSKLINPLLQPFIDAALPLSALLNKAAEHTSSHVLVLQSKQDILFTTHSESIDSTYDSELCLRVIGQPLTHSIYNSLGLDKIVCLQFTEKLNLVEILLFLDEF